MPQTVVRQVSFNSTCPLCGKRCYYYENEFGSKVWFDVLGVPWTKHPCFMSDTQMRSNRPKQATDALDRLFDSEPTVHRVFSKRLWRTKDWQFFAVLKDVKDMRNVYRWGRCKAHSLDVQDYEKAIGYFFARHTIENGPFSLISWENETFFALPLDEDAFQIFPTLWHDKAFGRVRSRKNQRIRDCFQAILQSAKSIDDPQDRLYLADLLYDQTSLPIETIAFLAGVTLSDATDISNGDIAPVYIRNLARVQRVAANVAECVLQTADLD